ncbi:MAG: SurA N-terminal domain-containing protein [Geoalkalibacter sp.]|jgi:peptidyl-prolyl cis-trans isomerase SurA|uniref:SurA N-terminal domain-containing protein n=1 Tax=Geoalkalibacter sp. TaxID=3041440 RepID=UPI002A944DA1|nr:SurA N-terminal domain-containing protein [Thermodesulfobacteriota bacterium]
MIFVTRNMKVRIFWTAALILLGAMCGHAEVLNKVAAVVNQDIITTYELEREIESVLAGEAAAGRPSPADNVALRQQVLEQLIEQKLVNQRVRELGLEVSEAEVEEAIDDVVKQNNITRDQLRQALAAQNLSLNDYREKLRQQILRFKLIGREVQSKVEVSEREVRDYFRENIDSFRGDPTVSLAYLQFAIPRDSMIGNTQVEDIRERAREALALLRQGEDFYSTIFIYSTDDNVDGGDLGTFTRDELRPSFARAVEGLEEGEVTDLIETPEGIFILSVEGRHPGPIRRFDTVKDEIREKLLSQDREQRFQEWSRTLKKDAHIEILI